MSAQALRLEVVDLTDADHWRWRLTDAKGAFLADYEVSLNPADPKYQALYNLPAYLWQYSSPDKRDEDERRLLAEVGAWIGDTVLGRAIGEKILAHGFPPIIVRVSMPKEAERLLVIPFEIAHARGKPLCAQRVSLVFEPVAETPPGSVPIGDRLRILALFSLPPAGNPLNLRRERQALNRLVAGLAGRAIELRVLQYGVTRDRLRDALLDGEGWDVIYFSGHGQPGAVLLERPDGQPDPINSEEVAELITEAGQRLKLVTLSACLSAASSIQQTMSWLGIAPASREAGANLEAADAAKQSQEAAATVARVLVGKLDCAVLAMRYAVGDEFAMTFGRNLYDGLFRHGQNLPRAAQVALDGALKANIAAPALSIATPALFGTKAADLQLVPPRGAFRLPETTFAEFPKVPEHFVGRVKAMTDASAALASDSNRSGILFHGMAGGGKTSCAVELAYHHRAVGRFDGFVWYEALQEGGRYPVRSGEIRESDGATASRL